MQASITSPDTLNDLCMIAQQVFLTMASMDLVRAETHVAPTAPIGSLLYYTEASKGSLLIECSPSLACEFTARMMAAPGPADEDVRDAMGELANMIGGNLKGLMPAETCISTPIVLGSGELSPFLGAQQRLVRICLECGQEHCCISLFDEAA